MPLKVFRRECVNPAPLPDRISDISPKTRALRPMGRQMWERVMVNPFPPELFLRKVNSIVHRMWARIQSILWGLTPKRGIAIHSIIF